MKFQFFAAALLLASSLSRADTVPDQLHNKFMVRVPYGESYFDYKLAKPTVMNPIRVLYTVSPSCPQIPSTSVAVQYEGTNDWQTTTFANGGYFQHSNARISKIRFNIAQYLYQSEQCELNILTKAKPAQQEVYAGYVMYNGGFVKDQEIYLIDLFKSNKVKFDVPDFCKGVEFMDVRLKGEGVRDVVLQKTSRDTFELPQTQDFDRLVLTLNGPRTSCDIPVYVYKDVD